MEKTIKLANKYLRTIAAIFAVILQIATAFQDVDPRATVIINICTAVTLAINWWYNNNFTTAAQVGQALTDELKNNPDVLNKVIDEAEEYVIAVVKKEDINGTSESSDTLSE